MPKVLIQYIRGTGLSGEGEDDTMKNILVVDESEFVLRTLASVPEDVGMVFGSRTPEDALEKIASETCNMAVSEVGLTGMGVMTFYHAAVKENPEISGRYIFFGEASIPASRGPAGGDGVPFVSKPDTTEIRKIVGYNSSAGDNGRA